MDESRTRVTSRTQLGGRGHATIIQVKTRVTAVHPLDKRDTVMYRHRVEGMGERKVGAVRVQAARLECEGKGVLMVSLCLFMGDLPCLCCRNGCKQDFTDRLSIGRRPVKKHIEVTK
jgi:hypothetical protein